MMVGFSVGGKGVLGYDASPLKCREDFFYGLLWVES